MTWPMTWTPSRMRRTSTPLPVQRLVRRHGGRALLEGRQDLRRRSGGSRRLQLQVLGLLGTGGPRHGLWAAFAAAVGLAPFPDPSNPYRYFPPGDQNQEYDVFTPTVGAQWHLNPDAMLYASFSKGFKAGGWTTRSRTRWRTSTRRLSVPRRARPTSWVRIQVLRSSPAGQRGGLLDRLHRHPAADPGRRVTGIAERGRRGVKGAELELEAIIGGGFSLNVAAGYIDAEYRRTRGPQCSASRSTRTCRRRRSTSSR